MPINFWWLWKKSSWIYGMPSEPSCSKSLRTLDNIQHFEQENGDLALSYVCVGFSYVFCVPAYIYLLQEGFSF